jgi:hypothetical protein
VFRMSPRGSQDRGITSYGILVPRRRWHRRLPEPQVGPEAQLAVPESVNVFVTAQVAVAVVVVVVYASPSPNCCRARGDVVERAGGTPDGTVAARGRFKLLPGLLRRVGGRHWQRLGKTCIHHGLLSGLDDVCLFVMQNQHWTTVNGAGTQWTSWCVERLAQD